MEELLLEILDHLLEAQEDGKTAHNIFGEDLKAYCDELINSSEHQNSFQQAAVIGFAVSLLLAVQIGYDTFTTLMQKLFSNTNTSGIPFSIPGTILSAIVLTIGAFITFSLFRRFSFTILVSWKQKHFSYYRYLYLLSYQFLQTYFSKQNHTYFIICLFCKVLLLHFLFIFCTNFYIKHLNFNSPSKGCFSSV